MRKVLLVCAVGAILPLALAIQWRFQSPPDFKTLWDAGRALWSGSPVYGAWFPYPPQSLFLFAPFALLPMWPAYVAFNLFGLALFVWAARPYLTFPAWLAALTPASLFCLYYGQTGLIVGALWLMAFQGKWPAVALLTFKPHLSVLSALSLNRKTLLPTILLALALCLAAYPLWGDFVRAIVAQASAIGVNTKWDYVGVSPAISYGVWGWAVFAIAALYLLSRNVTVWTAATAALLISPYGFHYDMPVASLGFALALHKEESPYKTVVFALALLAPVLVRFGAWVAPPILLLALWELRDAEGLGFTRRPCEAG